MATEKLISIVLVLIVLHPIGATSEEPDGFHDVWHHELGVAQVSNPRRGGQLSSSTTEAPPRVGRVEVKEERCNFGGQRLRVAVSPQPPLVNCNQDPYGDWLCNGSNIEMISVLENELNFRADWLVLADAGSSGTRVGGGRPRATAGDQAAANYTGVLALVASGRAWMSANGIMATRSRSQLGRVYLSEPFDSFSLHLLLSKSVQDHDHIFIKPFSGRAWLAILASALAIVPVFYYINTSSAYYRLQDERPNKRLTLMSYLKVACWHLLGQVGSQLATCRWGLERLRGRSASEVEELELDRVITRSVRLEPEVESCWRQRRRRQRLMRRKWALARLEARKASRLRRRSGFFRAVYIGWYVASSLTTQGGEEEHLPAADSTRILVAFWWLYLVVVVAIHSGILTAILTFPKQNDFIQTLEDYLAMEQPLSLLVDKHGELAELLGQPAENLHKSALQDLFSVERRSPYVEVDLHRHRQRILDEIQRGKAALLEERSAIRLMISQEYFEQRPPRCQFKSSRRPLDTVPMSLGLSGRLSAGCRAAIDRATGAVMRTGLAQKWRRKYEPAGNDCLETVVINAGDVAKIELRHVEFGLWLLGAGLALAGLALSAEIVWLLTADELDSSSSSSCTSSSSASSSTCSPTSSSGDSSSDADSAGSAPRLGHRAPRWRRRALAMQPPLPPPRIGHVESAGERRRARRRRRAERAAERRARRLRRTLKLVRKLHQGHLYTSLLGNLQSGARRASLAVGRLRRASRARVGVAR